MIVAVAVCPGAPLPVPGLAPGLVAAAPALGESCAAAVVRLRGTHRISLLTSGPGVRDRGAAIPMHALRHPLGTEVDSSLLTDSRLTHCYASPLAGAAAAVSGPVRPGMGVVVGAALLDAAGMAAPTTAIELRHSDRSVDRRPEVACLRDLVGGGADRVGVPVVGESGTRGRSRSAGRRQPWVRLTGWWSRRRRGVRLGACRRAGFGDPAVLTAAVAAGRSSEPEMLWRADPSFAALAGLCADLPPIRARLRYEDAPFGVGHVVATWSWE